MFRVSARTVLELGSELISSDIIAFYELIKNALDAGSKNGANIRFNIVLRKNAYLSFHDKLSKNEKVDLDALKILIIDQLNQDADATHIDIARNMVDSASSKSALLTAIKIYLRSKFY